VAAGLVEIFLHTEFQGGRHARRIAKIAQLEQHHS
jgi:ribose 5-phosphate isomerase RpiB